MTEQPPKDLHPVPAKSRAVTPKQATTAVGVVVVVVFALINLQDATMHWIVGTTHTPLIVLVAGCSLIGLGVGYLIGRRGRAPTRGSHDS